MTVTTQPREEHTAHVAETKVRTVRVDDELWEAAQAKAKRRRETVAAVIKRALLEYVEGE
jgi:predicted transcriptional regulator